MTKRDNVWDHFGPPVSEEGCSQKRRKCNYCNKTVNSNVRNAKTHYGNCPQAPRSIGRLPPLSSSFASRTSSSAASSSGSSTCTPLLNVTEAVKASANAMQVELPKTTMPPALVRGRLGDFGVRREIITAEDRKRLDGKFAKAMNASGLNFDVFDTVLFADFFADLKPGLVLLLCLPL